MTAVRDDFAHSSAPEPHRERTREILRHHPEIRDLIGPSQVTFWWALAIVTLQGVIAWRAGRSPWWVVFVLAYTVGAFANHALFVLIHECTHKLVFKRKLPNFITSLIANMPLFFPGAASFHKYHLKHHAFQGIYELDADLPRRWEARLVGRSALGKALWLLLYPFFQAARPWKMKEISVMDRWTWVNLGVQIVVNTAVYLAFGPRALVYLALSFFFSIGLHPLGARWIQRHYLTGGGEQETFSYYGMLNRLTFNVGYHNEHHDFPSVAWNRLPEIRATAPESYVELQSHMSWTRLLFQFLFDREISLWSRIVREDRGRVALNDEVKPDMDCAAVLFPAAPVPAVRAPEATLG
ncbi:MAG: fatty acid desaturase [Gemmatimonadales bacterium]